MTESRTASVRTSRALSPLITDERVRELSLRVAVLERERSAWEQERAAWVLATAARPLELVLALPSMRGLARRALSLLRRRLLG